MKKSKKIFLIIILAIIILTTGYIGSIYFNKGATRDAFSVIPQNAIYIIETNDLTKGWSAMSDSKIWEHIISIEKYSDINEIAKNLDTLIKGNKVLNLIISNRHMLISAHMTSGISYDFVFTIDISKASKISSLKSWFKEVVRLFDYSMKKRKFEGTEIIELTYLESKETLYLTFIENLLLCSYSNILVENAILQKDDDGWNENQVFQEVKTELSNRNLFNFYFNCSLLERFLKLMLSEKSDIIGNLSKSLEYMAFGVNFSNEQLNLEGYTNINDSIPSYLKALINVKPGKMRAHEIITDQAAIYISMCFNNFVDFQENLINEFSYSNTKDYVDYSKTISKVEQHFKINLEKDFFSWIGNEIAFVKPRPSANVREQDVILAFHTKDIDDAKKGMNNLTGQIQKKLPIKFKIEEYLNYEINYLNISGFFKLFFGKLFGRLEKPYFTFIDDFVVFSNSPTILKNFIDDYIKGKTLSHKKIFMDFKDNFSTKSNATIFIQTPKLYSHLLYYSKNEKKKDIKENKDVIISFARIGFQFVSDGKMFKTTFKAQFDENAIMDEEMEKFEAIADELFNKEYEALSFKINLTGEELTEYGPFTIYYEDSTIKAEGKINDEAINGLVRSYYPGGNIMSAINYDDGIVNGVALFYYDNDNQSIKSEVRFEEDVIVGEYREFYENGARKSFLNYKDGKANGDSEFYYSSGVLKMTGKYKGGLKSGKWKHYTETGQLLNKEKWKTGEKR